MFDAIVQEKLGYYIYALKNLKGEIFYVGKGIGNRCFDHINEARKNKKSTAKLDQIRMILDRRENVQIEIIRHGLSVPKNEEDLALLIEASIIDILDLTREKTNQIRGHGTTLGIESAEELQIKYGAKELISNEPLLLIKINDTYRKGMSLNEVYEITRKFWKIKIQRAEKCSFILGVANGIVRGVFDPKTFGISPNDKNRKYFEGEIIENSPYMNTSIKAFGKKGQRNPLVYLNA